MKWRLFRHILHGGDLDAERVYRWHIETRKAANAKAGIGMDASKADMRDYTRGCRRLAISMHGNGFLAEHAIPVDPDGELLGGAHRLSCALALELLEVPVQRHTKHVWAPAWGEEWFIAHGMAGDDLMRLKRDWECLASKK